MRKELFCEFQLRKRYVITRKGTTPMMFILKHSSIRFSGGSTLHCSHSYYIDLLFYFFFQYRKYAIIWKGLLCIIRFKKSQVPKKYKPASMKS